MTVSKTPPTITTDDLRAMSDEALHDIIEQCSAQLHNYHSIEDYYSWWRISAQACAERDTRALEL